MLKSVKPWFITLSLGAKIHRQESTDHDKKQSQTIHELNGFNEGLTRPFWSS